jgi:hypothetical protein
MLAVFDIPLHGFMKADKKFKPDDIGSGGLVTLEMCFSDVNLGSEFDLTSSTKKGQNLTARKYAVVFSSKDESVEKYSYVMT